MVMSHKAKRGSASRVVNQRVYPCGGVPILLTSGCCSAKHKAKSPLEARRHGKLGVSEQMMRDGRLLWNRTRFVEAEARFSNQLHPAAGRPRYRPTCSTRGWSRIALWSLGLGFGNSGEHWPPCNPQSPGAEKIFWQAVRWASAHLGLDTQQ